MQLPVEKAHEFHDEKSAATATSSLQLNDYQTVNILPQPQELETKPDPTALSPEKGPGRLHPKVITKIRELVAGGEVRVYAIRRLLR